MTESWYALRSKPRKEEVLWKQLLARDIEVYFPRIRVHPVNPRSRKLRPYFPGYMFVQADLDEVGLSKFNWMPFAIGLVSFDGVPAVIPENLMHIKPFGVELWMNEFELKCEFNGRSATTALMA